LLVTSMSQVRDCTPGQRQVCHTKMKKGDESEKAGAKKHPSVSKLEADVAYFDARLSMLGTPSTQYQKAQLKAYQALEGMLVQSLVRVRGKLLTLANDVEQEGTEGAETPEPEKKEEK